MKEKRFQGTVGFKLYHMYFASGGIIYFIFALSLIAISVGLRIFVDYLIGKWTDNFGLLYKTYIGILLGLGAATILFIVLRGFFFGHYISLVSFNIFHKFMGKLFKKNMAFFDTTPSG